MCVSFYTNYFLLQFIEHVKEEIEEDEEEDPPSAEAADFPKLIHPNLE
jgi:hypothetical protein